MPWCTKHEVRNCLSRELAFSADFKILSLFLAESFDCAGMTGTFDYLVRFVDEDGNVQYGNAPEEKAAESLVGTRISILAGNPFAGFKVTNEERKLSKVSGRSQTVLRRATYLTSYASRCSAR